MTENLSKHTINFFWGLTLRDALLATFFGVMVTLSKLLIRISINIPGYTGLIWMTLFVICTLSIQKGRAGSVAGFVAGTLAVFLFPGKDGFLIFFKYFIPAFSLDLLFHFIPILRIKWYRSSFASMIAYTLKISIDILSGLLLKIPVKVLLIGLKIFFLNHLLFGFMGGALGYFVYTRFLKKYQRKG